MIQAHEGSAIHLHIWAAMSEVSHETRTGMQIQRQAARIINTECERGAGRRLCGGSNDIVSRHNLHAQLPCPLRWRIPSSIPSLTHLNNRSESSSQEPNIRLKTDAFR